MDKHVCCKYMFQVFQLFQTDVETVLFGCCKVDQDVPCVTMALHVYCKFMFQMFHLFLNAFLQVFSSRCCKTIVLNVAKLHLLFKFPRARAKQSERNLVRAWKGAGGTVPQARARVEQSGRGGA